MSRTDHAWSDERTERLRELWAQIPKLSCSTIGAALGGLSRNAIIGKVSRLKLPHRPNPAKSHAPRSRKRGGAAGGFVGQFAALRAQANRRPALADCGAVTELPPDRSDCAVSLLEAGPDQCRYPLWPAEERSGLFCGAAVLEPGCSWCERHARVVYSPGRWPAVRAEAAE
jgi:GcrA cell cycle regulator